MNVVSARPQADIPTPEREAPSGAAQTGAEVAFGSLLAPLLQPQPVQSSPAPPGEGETLVPGEVMPAVEAARSGLPVAATTVAGEGTVRGVQGHPGFRPALFSAVADAPAVQARAGEPSNAHVPQEGMPSKTASTGVASADTVSVAAAPVEVESDGHSVRRTASEVDAKAVRTRSRSENPRVEQPTGSPSPPADTAATKGDVVRPASEGAAPPNLSEPLPAGEGMAQQPKHGNPDAAPVAAQNAARAVPVNAPVAPAVSSEAEPASGQEMPRLRSVHPHDSQDDGRAEISLNTREGKVPEPQANAAPVVPNTQAPGPEHDAAPPPVVPVAAEGEQEGSLEPAPAAEAEAPAPVETSDEGMVADASSGEAGAGEDGWSSGRREPSGQPSGQAIPTPLASDDSGTNVPATGKDVRAAKAESESAAQPTAAVENTAPGPLEMPATPTAGLPEAGFSVEVEPSAPSPQQSAPAESAAPVNRPETARAPLSAALMERWQADLQGLVTELRTEAGGWQRLRLRLDDEGGTVTLRARREDDRVAVTVAFSDPALRQVAQASAERLHTALETQLGQQVAFSFDGGGDAHQHASTGDRPSAPSAPSNSALSEPDRKAPLPRRTTTGNREWIG